MKNFWICTLFLLISASVCCLSNALAADAVYKDIYGNWVCFDPIANPGYDESNPNDIVYYPETDNPAFGVTYQDVINGTGFGFDDPAQGAARRARVVDALNYIAGVIHGENGSADIHFGLSLNNPGSPVLASCGAYYWTSPNGFQGGFVFDHITTGVDPYAGNPDAQGTFNFGYSWYSGTSSPGGQYDMLSVLVHELTHALGYSSLLESDGTSSMSGGNPGVFSYFDDWLANGNGMYFFSTAGGATFVGNPATDLLGFNNGVRFRGPEATSVYGSYPPIYAPSTWSDGSSVTHWADSVPADAIMRWSYTAGEVRRTYLDFEIAALEDLGYDLGTTSDVPATGPAGIAILLGIITICIIITSRKIL